jgi:hypothetical protein
MAGPAMSCSRGCYIRLVLTKHLVAGNWQVPASNCPGNSTSPLTWKSGPSSLVNVNCGQLSLFCICGCNSVTVASWPSNCFILSCNYRILHPHWPIVQWQWPCRLCKFIQVLLSASMIISVLSGASILPALSCFQASYPERNSK